MADDKITNDGFANEVADITFNRIATTFSDFMENIKTGQSGIAMDILKIKKTLEKTEEKVTAEEIKIQEHEERLNKKKEDIKEVKEEITTIKSDFEKYKENLRIIAEIKPTLTTLQNFINWWKWWKVALLIIFIIIFFLLLNIVSHSTGIVDIWNDRQGGIEQTFKNIREGHIDPIVRSVNPNVSGNEEIKLIQEDQLAGIKKRTEDYEKKYGHKLINNQ